MTVSEELEVTLGDKVDHRSLSSTSVLGCLVNTLSGYVEELVEVDGGGEGAVLQLVEMAHTNFTKITRVIFIHVDTVVVLSTGVTATTRMLTVLADTTMSHLDVAALLA